MRLEAVAKAGYYPTPPKTLEILVHLLKTSPLAPYLEGKEALDPCLGEGEALGKVASALRMRPVGIELDRERAKGAKGRGIKVYEGDARDFRATGFPLLWLNPPYDTGDEGERLEETFLLAYRESVAKGGVLVLIVPERGLPRLLPHLMGYRIALLARLPQKEYPRFRQAVVVAQRDGTPYLPSLPPSLPYLEEVEGLDLIPWSFRETPILERLPSLPEEEALALARRSPLWAKLEGETTPRLTPLLPLKPAHLALLVAGGMLDLEEVELEGIPHLLLGVLVKDTVTIEEEDRRIEREVYRMAIKALNLRDYTLVEVK